MNKDCIFIVWTNRSDAGKDTIADILCELTPCTKVKFGRGFKTWLEECLCLPYGALDDKTLRVQKVINPVSEQEEAFTYNELMYHFFHKFKELYPGGNYLVPGHMKNKLLNTPGHKVICDLRNQTELQLLEKISDKFNIILFHVLTDRGETKSTDNDIAPYHFHFVTESFTINNRSDVSKEQVERQIRTWLLYLSYLDESWKVFANNNHKEI